MFESGGGQGPAPRGLPGVRSVGPHLGPGRNRRRVGGIPRPGRGGRGDAIGAPRRRRRAPDLRRSPARPCVAPQLLVGTGPGRLATLVPPRDTPPLTRASDGAAVAVVGGD